MKTSDEQNYLSTDSRGLPARSLAVSLEGISFEGISSSAAATKFTYVYDVEQSAMYWQLSVIRNTIYFDLVF